MGDRGETGSKDMHDDLDRVMTNQAPSGPAVVEAFESLRDPAKTFGHTILALCPPSPERSTAIRKLREALMWGVASIALNQDYVMPGSDRPPDAAPDAAPDAPSP